MNWRPILGAICIALLAPAVGLAQEATNPAIWGIYYKCDQSQESRADEVVRQSIVPILDGRMEAGDISAWGWLAHIAGGEWRRAAYWVAADLGSALAATEKIVTELQEQQGEGSQGLTEACPTHDDYVWTVEASSQPAGEVAQERATAGLSVYYECDPSREARADTLVTTVLGPALNRQIEAGNLHSWSWLAHSLGGELRRAAAYDGPDHASILEGRAALISELAENNAEAVREFNEICPVHHDYLWDIMMSKP